MNSSGYCRQSQLFDSHASYMVQNVDQGSLCNESRRNDTILNECESSFFEECSQNGQSRQQKQTRFVGGKPQLLNFQKESSSKTGGKQNNIPVFSATMNLPQQSVSSTSTRKITIHKQPQQPTSFYNEKSAEDNIQFQTGKIVQLQEEMISLRKELSSKEASWMKERTLLLNKVEIGNYECAELRQRNTNLIQINQTLTQALGQTNGKDGASSSEVRLLKEEIQRLKQKLNLRSKAENELAQKVSQLSSQNSQLSVRLKEESERCLAAKKAIQEYKGIVKQSNLRKLESDQHLLNLDRNMQTLKNKIASLPIKDEYLQPIYNFLSTICSWSGTTTYTNTTNTTTLISNSNHHRTYDTQEQRPPNLSLNGNNRSIIAGLNNDVQYSSGTSSSFINQLDSSAYGQSSSHHSHHAHTQDTATIDRSPSSHNNNYNNNVLSACSSSSNLLHKHANMHKNKGRIGAETQTDIHSRATQQSQYDKSRSPSHTNLNKDRSSNKNREIIQMRLLQSDVKHYDQAEFSAQQQQDLMANCAEYSQDQCQQSYAGHSGFRSHSNNSSIQGRHSVAIQNRKNNNNQQIQKQPNHHQQKQKRISTVTTTTYCNQTNNNYKNHNIHNNHKNNNNNHQHQQHQHQQHHQNKDHYNRQQEEEEQDLYFQEQVEEYNNNNNKNKNNNNNKKNNNKNYQNQRHQRQQEDDDEDEQQLYLLCQICQRAYTEPEFKAHMEQCKHYQNLLKQKQKIESKLVHIQEQEYQSRKASRIKHNPSERKSINSGTSKQDFSVLYKSRKNSTNPNLRAGTSKHIDKLGRKRDSNSSARLELSEILNISNISSRPSNTFWEKNSNQRHIEQENCNGYHSNKQNIKNLHQMQIRYQTRDMPESKKDNRHFGKQSMQEEIRKIVEALNQGGGEDRGSATCRTTRNEKNRSPLQTHGKKQKMMSTSRSFYQKGNNKMKKLQKVDHSYYAEDTD